jgi:hypothetical protein
MVRERLTGKLVGRVAEFQDFKVSMTRQQVRIDSGPLLLGRCKIPTFEGSQKIFRY